MINKFRACLFLEKLLPLGTWPNNVKTFWNPDNWAQKEIITVSGQETVTRSCLREFLNLTTRWMHSSKNRFMSIFNILNLIFNYHKVACFYGIFEHICFVWSFHMSLSYISCPVSPVPFPPQDFLSHISRAIPLPSPLPSRVDAGTQGWERMCRFCVSEPELTDGYTFKPQCNKTSEDTPHTQIFKYSEIEQCTSELTVSHRRTQEVIYTFLELSENEDPAYQTLWEQPRPSKRKAYVYNRLLKKLERLQISKQSSDLEQRTQNYRKTRNETQTRWTARSDKDQGTNKWNRNKNTSCTTNK